MSARVIPFEGRYGCECTQARAASPAELVFLGVVNGRAGNGFCCEGSLEMISHLPEILRKLADHREETYLPAAGSRQ